ncbi:siderophore-interacting protein [Actinorugispora endophytica]|uniref:NADPH-dependent ferric siderophore reductase n=1 Tax=Actinorugispora endophytica TaxID=1605990 RepID=A0A4R6V670_9ACTN|nr:siderophore-interacting protein [Actinorugispora endophytica]TDQ54355.1 NADPH-dependent ferric siderophore reductase [Actinorugispora endophytica]
MAGQNTRTARTGPETAGALVLTVRRREQVSPHFVRVTFGGDDLKRFVPLGFDQWFRIFIPVSGSVEQRRSVLGRLPERLGTISYLRFLMTDRTTRPLLRNYTVREFRPDGPGGAELDVDFVVHGPADGSAPATASEWALACRPGDPVAILDEGLGFRPPAGLEASVVLAADESGLPAVAGVLRSLPAGATGRAYVEVPSEADRQDLTAPAGVEVTWLAREQATAPGRTVLSAVRTAPLPDGPFYGWVVGEQGLATGLRRHWVGAGVPKPHITFCGYWRHG